MGTSVCHAGPVLDYRDKHGRTPVDQVLECIDEIKKGTVKKKDSGRTLRVLPETRFYCYIVCDLVGDIGVIAKRAGMRPTPDNEGFFMYNDEYRAHLEIISFDKLMRDAHKRNSVLFQKLRLTP